MWSYTEDYHETTVLSADSNRPHDGFEIAATRLQRIAQVEINQSRTIRGHRYYICQITLHKTSAQLKMSDRSGSCYDLQLRYTAFHKLGTTLRQICRVAAPQCITCGDLLDVCGRERLEPSVLRHYAMPPIFRYSRLQKFVATVLDHTVQYTVSNATVCPGCEQRVHLLAAFLKQKYQPTTGII